MSRESRRLRAARTTMLVLALLSLVWLAIALPIYSHPNHDGLTAVLHGAPGLLLLAPAWLFTAIILVDWRVRGGRLQATRRLATFAIITPVCGLLGITLLATDSDMRLRFLLSQSQLTREAERVRNLPDCRDNRDRWVGLFRVRSAYTDGRDDLRLITMHTSLFGEAGFIHAVADPPIPDPGRMEEFTHLDGPWHAYFIVD